MSKNRTYRTISGDMWDQIAYEQMGSSFYSTELMKANKQHLKYYIFPAGIELAIPEVESNEVNSLPLWKRGMLSE